MTPVSVDTLRAANKDGRSDLTLQQINWRSYKGKLINRENARSQLRILIKETLRHDPQPKGLSHLNRVEEVLGADYSARVSLNDRNDNSFGGFTIPLYEAMITLKVNAPPHFSRSSFSAQKIIQHT